MKKSKKIVLLLLVIVFLFQAGSVFALEIIYPKVPGALTPQEIAEKLKKKEIEEEQVLPLYFKYFFSLSLIVITIICIAVSIYGGVLFLISGGSPVVMVDAKKWIFSGILGLAILFSSYLLLVTINPQLVIFEIPGITPPKEGPPPTISPPTTEKTIYQEIPIGTLVENILAKNIDCYDYDSEGNMVDAKPSTTSTIDKMKNHDRLDCLKKLAEAVRTKSEELKEKAEKLKELIDNCKCSYCNAACVFGVPTSPCIGDPCPNRGAIEIKRKEIKKLVTGEGGGLNYLSIREGISRLKEAKALLEEDLNTLIEAENLLKWDCQYGTILNLVKFFTLREELEYIDKAEFKDIDMKKYCIEFNCTEFKNPDDPKKKICIKYELNEGGRICELKNDKEYYVFDGDPSTFYCLTEERIGVPEYYGYYPYEYSPYEYPPYESLKTCSEQGGACCQSDQTCEGGYFVDSSDCGVSFPKPGTGRFTWNGAKLVYAGEINVDEVLAAGFNTVIAYVNQGRLDEALEKGLWIIPSVHSYFVHGKKDINGAVDFVNRWKHHPAIGAWYFLDEPELHGNTKEEQQQWYNALKATDPSRDFLTTFTTNPDYPTDAFNPNAFDHAAVDLYPFNDESFRYGPGEWNGNWQGYMDYALNRWNSLTGGIGGMAIAQTYHDVPRGMLNPSGNIGEMLRIFQEHGVGTQKDGYGMYAWTDGLSATSIGTSEDPALLSEVASVSAGYDWPHAPPQAGETGGDALCCVGGTCTLAP